MIWLVIPIHIASAISDFCCCGISCPDCVFNTDECEFYKYVPDAEDGDVTVEIDERVFKLITSDKEYFEKCKDVNRTEWEVIKHLFRGAGGASLG